MVSLGRVDEGGPSAAVPAPGAAVEVRMSRGRLATRPGHVVDVKVFEDVPRGTAIAVEWDDDRSVSWLVPGRDIEVTRR